MANVTTPGIQFDGLDARLNGDLIVAGDLTINGTETILDTQTIEVKDNILQLNTTQGSPDTATATTSGITIYRGSGVTEASFIFDDADDTWDLTNNLKINAIATSDTALDVNDRVKVFGNGTLSWGSAADFGNLTWDTGYALLGGLSGKGLKIFTNGGSNIALTIDTSQNATFAGSIKLEGPDGGLVLRNWTASNAYASIATNSMTNSEYALLTDGTNTFLSGGNGGYVSIRGGENDTTHALKISTTDARFYGAVVPNNNGTQNFGSSSNRWNIGYFSSLRITNVVTNKILKFDGSDIDDSLLSDDGTTVSSNANFIPTTDSTYNLGTTSLRWANIYADNVDFGGNSQFERVGINMVPDSAYQLATYYQQTNPDDDYRFAHYINADFSGADNTTGDREQGGIFMDIDSSADGDASNEHRLYGINIDQRFTGFSDLSFGIYSRVESNNNTEKTASMVGVYGYAVHDSGVNGGVSNMYGTRGVAQIEDNGDVDSAYGIHGHTIITSTRAVNVDSTYGGYFEVQIDSPNAITYGTMHAVRAVIDNNEGAVPTIGTQYLYYGDYQGTKGSNAYGLYLANEDKNYLSSKLGIGTTGNHFGEKLRVQGWITSGSDSIVALMGENGTGAVMGAYSNHPLILRTNNTERMRIDSSGQVGIGTTSPDAKLHVADTTTMTSGQSSVEVLKLQRIDSAGDIKASTEGHISMWGTDSNNNNEWARISWVNDNTSDGGLENEGALCFWTNTNGTLNRAMYINHDQNVGIGTTSPSSKLTINTGTGSDALRFERDSQETYRITHGTSGLYFTHPNSTALLFGLNQDGDITIHNDQSSEYVRFDNLTSSVGIGTTSPNCRLQVVDSIDHVSGSISVSDAILDLFNNYESDVAEKGAILTFSDYYNDGAFRRTTRAAIKGGTDTAGNTAAGFLAFYTDAGAANSATERMRIDDAGNVGIGVTAPSGKLHVDGIITTDARSSRDKIRVWSNGTYAIGMRNSMTYGAINNDYAMTFQMSNTTNRGFWWGDSAHTDAQGAMSLSTTGVATIATSLSIGEGQSETSPQTDTLFVSGSARLSKSVGDTVLTIEADTDNNNENDNPRIELKQDGAAIYTHLGINGDANNTFTGAITNYGYLRTNTGFHFVVNATGPLMVLDTNNRVGIGTTTPGAKLHVLGTTIIDGSGLTTDFQLRRSVNTAALLAINAPGGSPNASTFWINSNAVITIDENQKLGVRTTTPDAPLSVHGNTGLGIGASGIRVHRPDSFGQFGFLDYGQSSGTTYIGSSYTGGTSAVYGEIVFRQLSNGGTPSDTMTISSSNNVGIGITSPAEKLHVNGNLKVQGTITEEGDGNNVTYKKRTDESSSYTSGNALVKFGRIYWTPAHWSDSAPVLKITIQSRYYEGESRTYIVKANYQDTDPIVNQLQQSSTNLKIAFSLGATTSAGYNYAGQPVYYADLRWVQSAYMRAWVIIESQVGFLSSNPTSSWGGCVIDSSLTQTNGSGSLQDYNSFFNGSLGIGTESPSEKLDVNGNIRLRTGVLSSNNGTLSHSTNNLLYVFGGSSGLYLSDNTGQQNSILIHDTNYIDFQTAATRRLRIDSSGRMLVGLSGSGNIYVGGSTTGQYFRIHHNNSDTYLDGNGGKIYFRGDSGANTRFEMDMTGTNAGQFIASGDVVAFGSPSDKTLKENIRPIESALDKVNKLKGVEFNWKEQGITNLNEDIGFIAQDVQEVLPQLVRENENGKLSLRHQGIVPVLVEAIKELTKEIEILKTQINN